MLLYDLATALVPRVDNNWARLICCRVCILHQASSSRVREALAAGHMQRVAGYLGRRYRLIAVAAPGAAVLRAADTLWCATRCSQVTEHHLVVLQPV